MWQKNIYKNIIKYISYILLSPVLLFTFLKLTHPNYDKPKQKMTIEAAVNWPVFMSHGRDDKAKSRGKKKFCYQLLIYKSQKPLGERPWVICHSVAKSCLTLCDLMDCSTPGLPVHHWLWVYSDSYPLSQWCHSTILSSVTPFSSCLQSFPKSGSFQMSQLFTSGGQNIGFSASTSVLPKNIQDRFSLGWTGWISLQSKGLSRVFSNTTVQKHQFFCTQLSS